MVREKPGGGGEVGGGGQLNRAQAAVGLALVLVAIAAGIWWEARAAEPPPMSAQPASVSEGVVTDPAITVHLAITVHVAGLVSRPGLVDLPEGSRVADAIAAAGGLLPGANAESINLAAPVADGEQIVVAGPGPESPASRSEVPGGKLRLNLATAAELDSLPGVGPVIAERIVSYREEFGPFRSIDDLLDVPGIGEARLADLRDRLQVP